MEVELGWAGQSIEYERNRGTVQSLRLSKRRKLKFLREERITVKTGAHLSTEEKEVHQERLGVREVGLRDRGAPSSSEASTEVAGVREARAPVGWRAQVGCSCRPARARTGKSPGPRPRGRKTTQATDGRRGRLGRATSENGSAAGGGYLAHTHWEADSPGARGCRGARRAAARLRESP